jgi:hypothetical protein
MGVLHLCCSLRADLSAVQDCTPSSVRTTLNNEVQITGRKLYWYNPSPFLEALNSFTRIVNVRAEILTGQLLKASQKRYHLSHLTGCETRSPTFGGNVDSGC